MVRVAWVDPLDFRRGTLVFVCNVYHVLWTAAASGSTPPPPPSLLATEGEIMEVLLLEFAPLL
jgi:hypothetical protein